MNHSDVRLLQNLAPKGYEPLETLYEGRCSLVYRALRSEDQTAVIIKTTPPQVALRAPDHLAFRNQFTISQSLDHPGILQILGLEPCNHSYALIMEDVQSIALSTFLRTAVSLKDGLTIALQLAEILQYLSQTRIVHKDIKPTNILIHPQTLQVKLIDFGIASRLPKETQTIKNPKNLEGTLAYMAPEQTGRMNRGIDFRSDFYGLGVTLFELFSGQLPFQADEPMEWLHCHLAQKPPSLTEFGVPTAVANIVGKLLAKNAEDRYQSALGLKDDLTRCLTQLTEQGTIEPFEVGQNDVCDRFLIPEKLYGREAEVQSLLDAFDRVSQGASELMLVAGYSGVGKTAVVNEVYKPIIRQEGYFIKGKFDQFNRDIPFSAFVQAFSSLVQQLLSESDADLTQWKTAILTALGNNAQVVIEVIPSLEIILGEQPDAPELSGIAAQHRFNLVFNKFIRIFTKQEHPLVIFLDDLQWADSASLGLLKRLMNDSVNNDNSLLVIGTYRDNEVFPAHPLMLCLSEIELEQSAINTINLDPLPKSDINKIVSDSLLCSEVAAKPLSELIYQKTQGNSFFAIQFLKGLYEDNYVEFDRKENCWQCDLSQLQESALSDDALAYMVTRLHKLPETTQDVLKFAACIGNSFDMATLVVVCEKSELAVTDDLWSALQVGVIVPETQIYRLSPEDEVANTSEESSIKYRFLHDRVQQSAYALIPQAEKAKTHYQIGKLLNQGSSPENRNANIFDIVNQLNLGQALVSRQPERDQLAQLNLIAGTKAKNAIAYQASFDYAQIGLSLLGDNSWDRHYQLTLNLHNLATESAHLKGDFSVMESLVNVINQNTKTILDTVLAVQTQIQCYAIQQNYSSAISTGRDILQELGIYFPEKPSFEQVKQEYSRFQPYINQFSIQQIEELPLLKDPEKLAAANILLALNASALISDTNLGWLINLKLVKLSLEHGNSPYSAHGYVTYGILVNLIEQDIEKYYQFGQLSLHVVDIFPQSPTKSSILQIVGAYTSYLKSHFREARPLLSAAYITGLESGDFEFGGYSVSSKCQNLFFSGEPLTTVQTEFIQGDRALEQLNNQFAIGLNRFLKQLVAKLTGQLEQPNSLASDCFSLEEINESLTAATDRFSLQNGYLYEATLQYLFLNTNLALANIKESAKNLDSVSGWLTEYIHYFYESLIYLDCINFENPSEEDLVDQYLEKIEKNQKKYQIWADHAPMNFQHKLDLVEAEKHRVLGNKFAALELYDKAIAGAKENQFIQEEALANERAAKFYLDWGKEKIAAVYMQEAYFCYERWGAQAKTNDLADRYASLLEPILQQTNKIDPLATLHSIAPLSLTVHSSGSSSQPTTDSFNTVLDLATILKSAQALSASIGLNELLKKLAPMMLQTSGAERLALLLPDTENVWQEKVMATVETTQLVSDPMTDNPHLPVQLLQYIQRTQEVLVVDGLSQSLPVVDPYLQDHPHRSVLCLPLLHQTKLIGLLYLEHHSVAGVFSRDRITILNFLCTQAAISLENALLNQELERKLEIQTGKREVSEARFRNMVNNIPGVVFQARFTADGVVSFTYISPDCEDLWEVSAEAILSGQCSPRDFDHPEDRPIIDQKIAEAGQTAQQFDQEFRMVTPSGKLKWIYITLQPTQTLPDGSILWDGLVLDISDRKQLEQEQSRLTQILQSTSDFVGICQPEKGILWQNRPFRQLRPDLNITEEQVPISKLYPEWAFEIVQKEGLPAAIEQGTWSGETALLTPAGDEIPTSQVIIAHKSEQGKVEYLSTILRDISDRKAIEQQLEFTQYGLDHAADCFYCLDEEANIVQVNQAACQRTGYTKDQLLNLAFHELTPTCPKETTWQPHWEKLKRLKSYSFESVQKTATGEIFPVEVVCNYLEFDGKAYDFELVRDISARKAAEQELILTKFAIDNAATGILWINSEGRLPRVNESACISLGYGREELQQLSIWDITPDIQAEDWSEHWATMHSKIHARYETYHQTQDGRVYPVEITSNYLEFDGMGHLFVQFQDISDRKQAERALQLSEARANATFEQAEVGIVEGSFIDGKITRTNNCFCQMTGYIDQELQSLAIEDLTHPEDLSDFQDRIQQLYLGEIDSFTVEKRCISKKQSFCWVNATVSLIQNPEETSPHWFAVVQDISDRKLAELSLQQSEEKFRTLVSNLHGAVYRSLNDAAWTMNYMSDAIFELSGYPATDFVTNRVRTYASIIHPEDKVYVDESVNQAVAEQKSFVLEYRIHHRDGGIRWVYEKGQGIFDQHNQFQHLEGVIFDISDRKNAELALKENQEQFQRMTENIPGVLYRYVLHADGSDEFTYIDSQLEKLFEISLEDSLKSTSTIWNLVHSEDIPRVLNELHKSGATQQPLLVEYRLNLPLKGLRWVQLNAQPESLANGDIVWDGVCSDISDRKQAEQQLQELSERLELAVESAQLGIWVWDHQDNHLTWDDRMFEIYGVSPEEFGETYEDWANRVHPEDLVQLEAQSPDSVIGSTNTYTQEFRIICSDSTIRYILATATVQRDNEGQPIRSVGMNLDMTDRKEAEQALLQQQTHLSALLNNIPHFTWLKDAKGRYIAVNDTYEELCGISMDKIVGRTDDDLWSTELASSYQADDAQVLASGQRKSIVEQFSRADGTLGWLETTKTPFKDEQGKWAGTVGIAADITDRKTAEAKLKCTNAELLRATQHKSEFLASMSHELRTPLNAVLGYSQLMQRNPSFPTEHREKLDAINRNGEHLLALITNILEMSKIEAGRITLDPSQVELPLFLDDIYQTFIIKAKAKKIDLQLVYSPKITRYIKVDSIKLRQILFNLMSNALKFTQEGQVCLHAQVLDMLYEHPHTKAHLQFSVSDTGPGIDVADLETIFEPFIQSETGKQHYQGTGLGLSISRKFAQMMDGDLRASSTLGQGSTFLCDIFVQVISSGNEVDHGQEHHYHNIEGLKNQQLTYRLLVVDDNADNRDFLYQLLSIPGFEVRQAIDGSQAVELNASWQPHLICMDMNMPHMDGLEATRLIRNSCTVPKIIAITASAFADDQQAALDAGCDDFLAKPFTSDKLFEKIATQLGVEFIQAEAAEPITQSLLTTTPFESIESVIKKGVKMMPVSWQKDLKQSVLTLDEQSMQEILANVPIENREMADAISSLLYDFRFDILSNLLEEI